MTAETGGGAAIQERPALITLLGWYAIIGCIIFAAMILIADFVVPDHDWIADTISDLGAGKYEFIVDIGIYAFSASLISIALLAAHVHLGNRRWSFGIVGFTILGLIVFLVGARNEYGDNDKDGVVIHSYLVYALGVLMAVLPWCMSEGARRCGAGYAKILVGLSVLWTISAPVFFMLPSDIDGIYERYLGVIAMTTVITLATMFLGRGQGRPGN
ncbi:DUF998 domain-containing protein [Paracoccus sp. 1_MG-2023]|uniref:DUF998 domain-containing protein n=1 Tax=unclassified Paracoccus (in: a-proteobacteria) TaxID=2688777 RepID=UPI001C098E12|nr:MULTISPECIES: DUF998 domain-containing protein [unclassified Paracoccus (in: a-proteobacteria)]MBU2959163.1 DUF998 domain-containing protein [Paracoccus sp. C2R09]MDO6670100.1 DUF998 domain-containing protein [Paracoccus sp. 1_MG-2023]